MDKSTGIVVIEDDVEIGACCGIGRGTLGDTVIGQGSKLGGLIAIGQGNKSRWPPPGIS